MTDERVQQTYDADARLASRQYFIGMSPDAREAFEYDEAGRRIALEYEREGDGRVDERHTFEFDADGHLIEELTRR